MIRATGIPEKAGENCTEQVIRMMNTHVRPERPLAAADIEAAHRIGAPRGPQPNGEPPRPRPIILRFHSRARKFEILENRKELKPTSFALAEDMTKKNVLLLNRARNSPLVSSAWFTNGRVKARHSVTDKIAIVNLFDTVEDCFSK